MLLRGRAADEDGVTACRTELLAERFHQRESGVAERVLRECDREERSWLSLLNPADGRDLRGRFRCREHRLELCRIGDDHRGRCARAGGERALEQVLALHRLDLTAERVAGGEVRVERQHAEREGEQRECRHDPDGAVAPLDPRAEPSPEGRAPRGVVRVGVGAIEARDVRPERPAAADEEERGEDREHRQRGDGHSHRADRAEAGGRVDRRQREAEEGRDDGACRCEDPGARLPHRDPHRLVLVLVPVELLPVARGEQEGVVGSGAEDEDEQDPARLPVDDDAGVDEERADPAHEPLREEHGEERQRPEDRAAVDDHEEDEDEERRREQEGRVDPLERLARVRRVPGGACHLRLEARREARGDRRADLVDRVDEDLLVTLGDDLDDEERRLAVLGRPRRAHRDDAFWWVRVELGLDARDVLAVGCRQAALAGEDDDRLDAFRRGELVRQLERAHGLRVGGEEARRLVALLRLEAADQRPERDERDEPESEDDELRAASGDDAGEPGHGHNSIRKLYESGTEWCLTPTAGLRRENRMVERKSRVVLPLGVRHRLRECHVSSCQRR